MNRSILDGVALALVLALAACSEKQSSVEESPASPPTAQDPSSDTPPVAEESTSSSGVAEAISAAQTRLEAGEFDTAAADLLRLQIESARFSNEDAAAYREALSQTMIASVAAADKGDPRGQAALQLLRATRRR